MNDRDVTDALGTLRDDSAERSRRLEAPDIDRLIELADAAARVERRTGPADATPAIREHRRFRRPPLPFVPTVAAAAALVVVAMGLVLFGPRADAPVGDPPGHLVALVDSLYDDGIYVIDDISPLWDASPAGTGYLDGVWSSVADELAPPVTAVPQTD